MTDAPVEPVNETPGAVSCAWTVRDTPIGPLLLAATGEGLVNVVFHARGHVLDQALARLSGRFEDTSPLDGAAPAEAPPSSPAAHLDSVGRELTGYFDGAAVPFTVPLDWSLTGGFHERVLRELAESVPYGTTVGYQDLAVRVGEPGAARAVGVAMGANPLPVVVPCHRVLESSGGIGGFGGGLETKRTLLTLEGVLPEPLF
ncbi:methylated-DNA--[protein]-cysteine S-methyltransferase [Streptomyces sp. NBC_01186]|uniref:methylated-DNA--[protein]-cysteine S-methyltransferase n=1 Tax=unclassified Streptomyces TaxID=2593676 RepID=UPI002DDC66EE|nr:MULTISPECIES: methylated-DNA--[protein]-cysteine S-methyltransferase [unclassified Streptomyces]WSB80002.1 methylated-DNA--[protein]-cysteine S-methyltransferase [Streptomyces sp. NBC_01775]WSS11791.1 methylated-DNA--[protein]-cysteine S-methyltransferase [Streptomyces sp. NBC_01186]